MTNYYKSGQFDIAHNNGGTVSPNPCERITEFLYSRNDQQTIKFFDRLLLSENFNISAKKLFDSCNISIEEGRNKQRIKFSRRPQSNSNIAENFNELSIKCGKLTECKKDKKGKTVQSTSYYVSVQDFIKILTAASNASKEFAAELRTAINKFKDQQRSDGCSTEETENAIQLLIEQARTRQAIKEINQSSEVFDKIPEEIKEMVETYLKHVSQEAGGSRGLQ